MRPAAAESPEKAQIRIFASKTRGAPTAGRGDAQIRFSRRVLGAHSDFRSFCRPIWAFSRQNSGSPDFSVEAFDAKIRGRREQVRERSKKHFRVESRPRRRSAPISAPQGHATRLWQRQRDRPGTVRRTRAPPTRHCRRGVAQRLRRPQLPPPRPARATPPERRRSPHRRGRLPASTAQPGPGSSTASRRVRRGAPRPRPGHGQAAAAGEASAGGPARTAPPATDRKRPQTTRPAAARRRRPPGRVELHPGGPARRVDAHPADRPSRGPPRGSPARRVEPRAVPDARIAPRRPPTTPLAASSPPAERRTGARHHHPRRSAALTALLRRPRPAPSPGRPPRQSKQRWSTALTAAPTRPRSATTARHAALDAGSRSRAARSSPAPAATPIDSRRGRRSPQHRAPLSRPQRTFGSHAATPARRTSRLSRALDAGPRRTPRRPRRHRSAPHRDRRVDPTLGAHSAMSRECHVSRAQVSRLCHTGHRLSDVAVMSRISRACVNTLSHPATAPQRPARPLASQHEHPELQMCYSQRSYSGSRTKL